MSLLSRAVLCLVLLLLPSSVIAQQQSGLQITNVASLSVTTSSGNVRIGANGTTIVLWNTGSTDAYYAVGAVSGTVATTSSARIPAGAAITLNVSPQAYVAAITASSTTTINITQGFGWPALAVGGTTGSVTVTFPTIGAAVPATGIYTGINVAGNLRGITGLALGSTFSPTVAIVDASGNQITTFGGNVAQGSTTSAQTGPLAQGAVTTSAPTYTTAQTSPLSLDTSGSLRVSITNLNGNGQATMVNSAPVVIASNQSTIPTNLAQIAGGTVTATNVAITDAPLNLGVQAVSSENTAVTTARKVQLVADLAGKLIVLPYANPENFVSGVITSAMTGTTTTSLIAAPASGLRNYITQITCSNAHATVGTDIIIQDGSGGTTIYSLPAAAVYGGAVLAFPTPLRQPTTATAVFVANVTTGASTKCAASGYKGA